MDRIFLPRSRDLGERLGFDWNIRYPSLDWNVEIDSLPGGEALAEVPRCQIANFVGGPHYESLTKSSAY